MLSKLNWMEKYCYRGTMCNPFVKADEKKRKINRIILTLSCRRIPSVVKNSSNGNLSILINSSKGIPSIQQDKNKYLQKYSV